MPPINSESTDGNSKLTLIPIKESELISDSRTSLEYDIPIFTIPVSSARES